MENRIFSKSVFQKTFMDEDSDVAKDFTVGASDWDNNLKH